MTAENLYRTLRKFVEAAEPLVALKELDEIDHQLREKLKLTSYMRRHALLDAVQAEGPRSQARVGRTIGLSRQRTHDMVERAAYERLHKIEVPMGAKGI
jgi:hypothetical protein|tara:strand:- start:45 stop:341 length:297 start_codon:yes stop_codon:yes gene_type:complete